MILRSDGYYITPGEAVDDDLKKAADKSEVSDIDLLDCLSEFVGTSLTEAKWQKLFIFLRYKRYMVGF